MGILNVTPDSFFDGGKYFQLDSAIAQSKKMIDQGATIIDVGGESSRPFSKSISIQEEIKRVVPVIEALKSETKITLSVDTSKYEVAKECLKAGATIINDISALRSDDRMSSLVAENNVHVVLMHMKGTPQNMQINPIYKNLIKEPGLGFGKSVKHNYVILNKLSEFLDLNCPILIGSSRKSFIGKTLGSNSNRLFGTAATIAISILKGAKIFRVHDVKQIQEVIAISEAIISAKE